MRRLPTETQRIDFEELSRDLLRQLRGRRSQAAWSKRLGYGSNVAYLWETGRRRPDASTFFKLAATDKRRRGLSSFLRQPLQLDFDTDPQGAIDVGWMLRELAGELTTRALSERVGVDRSTLARWLHGQTQPRLAEFLRFIDASSGRLLDFVSIFVDPRTLPSTRVAHERLLDQRRIAYEHPWSHAVLHALSAHRGANQVSRIARSIGLTHKQVREQLAALQQAGVVQKTADGAYQTKTELTVDTGGLPDFDYRLKRHWAQVGLERLDKSRAAGSGLFSYNLFPIAERDYQRLRELHLSYYDQVRQLVAAASGADRVVLINVQLVPLDE